MLLWTLGCMYLFKLVFFFWWGEDIYQGEGFLVHVEVPLLVVWEIFILCSTVTVPIYILINSVQGFSLLHIFANILYFCSFLMIDILTELRCTNNVRLSWLFLILDFKMYGLGTSLAVQWLRLCIPNAGGIGFNPWLGNENPACCRAKENPSWVNKT